VPRSCTRERNRGRPARSAVGRRLGLTRTAALFRRQDETTDNGWRASGTAGTYRYERNVVRRRGTHIGLVRQDEPDEERRVAAQLCVDARLPPRRDGRRLTSTRTCRWHRGGGSTSDDQKGRQATHCECNPSPGESSHSSPQLYSPTGVPLSAQPQAPRTRSSAVVACSCIRSVTWPSRSATTRGLLHMTA
jgi:hypothetical protein